jgi:TetR/AcrR family transcriptional regulator, tetracycline repressor protein
MSSSLLAILLDSVDAVMRAFVEAGFDDETAARSIALLADIAVTHARDVVEAQRTGEGTRHTWLRAALDNHPGEKFLYADRLASSSIDTYDRRQLEYSVDVFLRGTEPLREQSPGRP